MANSLLDIGEKIKKLFASGQVDKVANLVTAPFRWGGQMLGESAINTVKSMGNVGRLVGQIPITTEKGIFSGDVYYKGGLGGIIGGQAYERGTNKPLKTYALGEMLPSRNWLGGPQGRAIKSDLNTAMMATPMTSQGLGQGMGKGFNIKGALGGATTFAGIQGLSNVLGGEPIGQGVPQSLLLGGFMGGKSAIPTEKVGGVIVDLNELRKSQQIKPGFQLGRVRIHFDDLGEMSDFIDYVRGQFKPTENPKVYEGWNREMASYYGINPNQPNGRLALAFEKVLSAAKWGTKEFKQNTFNYKGAVNPVEDVGIMAKIKSTQPKGVGGVPEGGVGVKPNMAALQGQISTPQVETATMPVPKPPLSVPKPPGGGGVLPSGQQSLSPAPKTVQSNPKILVSPAVEAPTKAELRVPQPKLEQPLVPGVLSGSGQGAPSSGVIISDKDLVTKLTQTLKAAEPVRGTQEKLYSAARSQSLAKMMEQREKMAGEKGFYQELGALKGELPKVQYESIRQEFSQSNVDRLFNMVKENKILDDWDKINAQVGLSKILGEKGGGVPTKGEIAKLYDVFGKEFTETLLNKRPLFAKLGDWGMQAYNLPRSIMAGVGDLSGTLMQNAQFAYRHPIMTAKNFVQQLRFFASENAFKMSGEEIAARPTYKLMKDAKLSLTEVGPIASQREEQFMASIAEKIPGLGKIVKATGRAYTGFLNRMRADVFDYMVNVQKGMGGDIADPKFLKDTGHFVNIFTGRGDLGQMERIAPVLGQGLFSARKLMATFQTLDPRLYVTATPAVRKEALLTMLSYLGGATMITQLLKLAGAEVGDDPTSTDFGKVKFGNTRFNLYGPYQQLAVFVGRQWKGYATSSTTGNKMMLGDPSNPYAPNRLDLAVRYLESKEHPTLSLAMGAMKGENSIGQPFNAPVEIMNRFTPMVLSDGYDLYKEHGPIGLLGTIPTILGIPTQTYGSMIPTTKTTPSGKVNIKLNAVPGLQEDIVNKITGNQVSNIPQQQWSGIVSQKQQESKAIIQKADLKQQLESGKVPTNLPNIDLDTAKLMFEYSSDTVKKYDENTYFYKDEEGAVKTLKVQSLPEKPTLTGLTELDKKVKSGYISDLTSRATDIVKLWELGQINQDEAEKALNEIKKLKESVSPKKMKKLSVPKINIKPLKIKSASVKKIKFKKAPTFKITNKKAPNISIKVPKSKISGLKVTKSKA